MINTIVFFVSSPFSRRDYERFGIELLNNNGFNVKVLDCTSFINEIFYMKYEKDIGFQFYGKEVIRSLKLAVAKVREFEVEETIIIDLLGKSEAVSKLKYEMKYSGIMTMELYLGILPNLPHSKLNKKRFLKVIKSPLFVINRFHAKFKRYLKERRLKNYPDIVVLSGEECLKIEGVDNKKIIWAHALDYDQYLLNKINCVSKSRIVFLDEDMLFHSDFDYLKIMPPASIENYYSSLNNFFNELERITNEQVVIAAHPRSNYEKKPELFQNRKVIKGKTAELVKNADLILFHATTSINFVILWEKPAVCLTTNELKNSWIQPRIECMANKIGAELINIDDIKMSTAIVNKWSKINVLKYKEYMRSYIKKEGSSELPVWQIISDYLNNIKGKSSIKNV